ncbi:MAG: YkgJ family cysteine cluster protein [Thermodesulfobacteriota bacterium]
MKSLFVSVLNPFQWLTAYLHTRAQMASLGSEFHCHPACTRPGCKDPDLQVQVSLVDLLGAASLLGEPLLALYRQYYSPAIFSDEREDWLRTAGLKLKKPCPFLANDLCGIYPVRPLPCILFPEYLAAEGKFEVQARKGHFRDYLCFQGPLLLSPERAGVMARLKRMWARETLITSFYLFGHGPCYLDFSNLTRELRQQHGGRENGDSEDSPKPGSVIPHPVLERFFLEHLARLPPFSGVEEKIDHLQDPGREAEFLRLMQDDRLLRRLKQDRGDRALVFRLVRGKLQGKRRSLLPAEYKFY